MKGARGSLILALACNSPMKFFAATFPHAEREDYIKKSHFSKRVPSLEKSFRSGIYERNACGDDCQKTRLEKCAARRAFFSRFLRVLVPFPREKIFRVNWKIKTLGFSRLKCVCDKNGLGKVGKERRAGWP
jgi:hypothetical protein